MQFNAGEPMFEFKTERVLIESRAERFEIQNWFINV
jgi:hypothetical protein